MLASEKNKIKFKYHAIITPMQKMAVICGLLLEVSHITHFY